jgi:RHS repeat-associated protein
VNAILHIAFAPRRRSARLARARERRKDRRLCAITDDAKGGHVDDDFGNLKSKGTGYTGYTYAIARPHAVTQVTAGGINRGYSYDSNGNLTSVTGSNAKYNAISWWVSNLAKRVTKTAGAYSEFTYGPDRARYKQYLNRSATDTETTVYVGGLMERATKVLSSTTTIDTTHYVRAGDAVITLVKRTKVGAAAPSSLIAKYPHRDHLGSLVALTDAGGALLERSAFDPWGKRVDYSTWTPPAPGTFVPGGSGAGGTTNAVVSTKRGFTGHEMVDDLGFIHMNGRIYDAELGKFLSADPTMQFPESTQGFNRYSYVGNNPLSAVDPSGFSIWKNFLKVVGIIMAMFPPANFYYRILWTFVSGFLAAGGELKGGTYAVIGMFFSWNFSNNIRSPVGPKSLFGVQSANTGDAGSSDGPGKWFDFMLRMVQAFTTNDKGPDGKLGNRAGTRSWMEVIFGRNTEIKYVGANVYFESPDSEHDPAMKARILAAYASALTVVDPTGKYFTEKNLRFVNIRHAGGFAGNNAEGGLEFDKGVIRLSGQSSLYKQSDLNSLMAHELEHIKYDIKALLKESGLPSRVEEHRRIYTKLLLLHNTDPAFKIVSTDRMSTVLKCSQSPQLC